MPPVCGVSRRRRCIEARLVGGGLGQGLQGEPPQAVYRSPLGSVCTWWAGAGGVGTGGRPWLRYAANAATHPAALCGLCCYSPRGLVRPCHYSSRGRCVRVGGRPCFDTRLRRYSPRGLVRPRAATHPAALYLVPRAASHPAALCGWCRPAPGDCSWGRFDLTPGLGYFRGSADAALGRSASSGVRGRFPA